MYWMSIEFINNVFKSRFLAQSWQINKVCDIDLIKKHLRIVNNELSLILNLKYCGYMLIYYKLRYLYVCSCLQDLDFRLLDVNWLLEIKCLRFSNHPPSIVWENIYRSFANFCFYFMSTILWKFLFCSFFKSLKNILFRAAFKNKFQPINIKSLSLSKSGLKRSA